MSRLSEMFKKLRHTAQSICHTVQKVTTSPFTRSARHKIEDSYREAMQECQRQENEALQQLNLQKDQEHKKINAQIKEIERIYARHKKRESQERDRLNTYLETRRREIDRAINEVKRTYDALRAGILACMKGEFEIIKELLNRGGEIKAGLLSFNLLHFAADNNHTEIIHLLCQQGADVFRCLESGETPLDIAKERGNVEAEKVLQEIIQETIRFWFAVDENNLEAMKSSLAKSAAVNSTLPDGSNILKYALQEKKSFGFIACLVYYGVDLFHPGFSSLDTNLDEDDISVTAQIDSKNNHETNTLADSKNTAEKKVTAEIATPSKYIKNIQLIKKNLMTLIEQGAHDWCIKDLILHRLNYNSLVANQDPVIEWSSKKTTDCDHLISHLPYICTPSYNPRKCSAILQVNGKKQFFSLGGVPSHGIKLISYEFDTKQWFRHYLTATKPIPLNESNLLICNKLGNKDRKWQASRFKSHAPIQVITSENNPKELFLLSQKDQQYIELWRYQPNKNPVKWTRCSSKASGPKLGDYWGLQADITCTMSLSGKEIFLIARQNDKIEFWSYSVQQNVWKQQACDIQFVSSSFKPQITTAYTAEGHERLFVLLEQKSPNDDSTEVKLYGVNPKNGLWHLHSRSSSQGQNSANYNIQMKKSRIQGKDHLFILLWPHQKSLASPSLLKFDCETFIWDRKYGAIPEAATFDNEKSSIVHLDIVPDYFTNTDILILLTLNDKGLNTYACYPLFSPDWIRLHQHSTDKFKNHLATDCRQKVQMQVDIVRNEYNILMLSEQSNPDKQAIFQTSTINVGDIQTEFRKRNAKPLPEESVYIFEVNRNEKFLDKIAKATQLLLEAANKGDSERILSSLKNGADIYATNADGRNALQLALRHPINIATIDQFIKAGIPLTHRDKAGKTVLDIAKEANQRAAHDYLADLMNKHSLMANGIDPKNSEQAKKLFSMHLQKAKELINGRTNPVQACQYLLQYLRLLNTREPYALYVWPGMILLGEILCFLPKDLENKAKLIENVQDYFAKTRAMYKTLCAIGVEHHAIITQDPEFQNTDWTPVIRSIQLQEALEKTSIAQNSSQNNDETILKQTYQSHKTLVLEGIQSTLQSLTTALEFEKGNWVTDASLWIAQQLESPVEFRDALKQQFKEHFLSMAGTAKEAQKMGLILLRPALNSSNEFKAIFENECIALAQVKKLVEEQPKELTEWIQNVEKNFNTILNEYSKQLKVASNLHVDIDRQIERARADLQAQFASCRQRLYQNKEQALHHVQKKAFKSLVIMVGACAIASFAAPILASYLPAALPTSLGISSQQVTIILKGAIMGGINGGFSGQNVLKSTLKGAGFAYAGCAIGNCVGAGLEKTFPNLSQNSATFKNLHTILSTGLEATARATAAGGRFDKNIVSDIGTGLLMNKLMNNEGDAGKSLGFMEELQGNLLRAFVGGSIHAAVHKEHLGSSICASAIIAGLTTGAERTGSQLGSSLAPRMYGPNGIQGGQQQVAVDRTKVSSKSLSARGTETNHRRDIAKAGRGYDRYNSSETEGNNPLIFSLSSQPSRSQASQKHLKFSDSSSRLPAKSSHTTKGNSHQSQENSNRSRIASVDEFFENNNRHKSLGSHLPHVRPMQNGFEKTVDFFIPTAHASSEVESIRDRGNFRRTENLGASSNGGKFIHRFSTTQEIIDFRTVGARSVVNQYYYDNLKSRPGSLVPLYTVNNNYWTKISENSYLHPTHSFSKYQMNSSDRTNHSRWTFSLPSSLPSYHQNPTLNAAIQIGRGIEIARDSTIDAILHPVETVLSVPLLIWDMSGAASQFILGKCTEGSRIRNHDRWSTIELSFSEFRKADIATQLGIGAQITSSLIFGAAIGGASFSAATKQPILLRYKSSNHLIKNFDPKSITIEKVPLTKQKIINYLENIQTITREKLIIDIESIGLRYVEGSGDGKFCKFAHKNKEIRVEIHAPHLKGKNGAKYDHIHIYDKLGNTLDWKLKKVKFNSPDAHIQVKELEHFMLWRKPE